MTFIQSKQVSSGGRTGIAATDDTALTVRLRIGVVALSCILGIYALWQLAAALMHPAAPYFLSEPAPDLTGSAPAAARSAQIAFFRGDFWFDNALLTWLEASGGRSADHASDDLAPVLDQARAAAVRAARLAPHDARTWLLLALIDRQRGLDPAQQAEALKMSYYTGPNDLALIPSRLRLAAQSAAIADPDFQALVSGDVFAAVRRPALQSAIISAYRQASPDGKRFLQSAASAFDPELAGRMRATDGDPLRF